MNLENLNFLAILVSALVSFALGSLWYSPLMFGKTWQKAVDLSDEKIKNSNMFKTFGFSFILMIIMAFGLALLFNAHGNNENNWLSGLIHGVFVGIFFVATSYGVNMLYQQKPLNLWAIDSGYQIILLGIMGTIIGAW